MRDLDVASDDDDEQSEAGSKTFDALLADIARSESREPPPSRDPFVGSTLGHYRIVAVLGRGGMGVVYRAEDSRLARDVALKVLPASVAGEAERRRRFLREARAAAAINHPNLVTIYEVGDAGGRLFLAMEVVDGVTLRTRIARGPFEPAEALRVAREIALGLARAQEKGVVHRDLKPENVMLTPDGGVKILDFGLAKLREPLSGDADDASPASVGSTLTHEGRVLGTPGYMSPEQATGKAVDQRTDVYALGIVLHEMLTGELPGALGSGRVVADPRVASIVTRALARETGERWGSAREMVVALQALEGSGEEGRGARTSVGVAKDRSERPLRSRRRVPWRAVGIASLVGAAAVGGTAAYCAAYVPRVRYCVRVVESEDGMRCVFPDVQGFERRPATARVTEVAGRIVRVDVVNFTGHTAMDSEEVLGRDEYSSRVDIVRAGDGTVRDVVFREPWGAIAKWERWSESGRRVDLVDVDGVAPRHEADSRVTMIRRKFDAQGLIAREQFFGVSGRPRADAAGAYGYELVNGSHAHPIRRTVLAADGKQGSIAEGISRVEISDDDESPSGRDTYDFDIEGQRATEEGMWHQRFHFNRSNVAMDGFAFFGLRDQPVARLDYGYAEQRIAWDWKAPRVTFSFLDARGRPCTTVKANAAARWNYDARGRLERQDMLDDNGNLVVFRGAEASSLQLWDDRDNTIELRSLDAKGLPMVDVDFGYARRTIAWDELGSMVETRDFDEDGRPASFKGGAVQRFTRDARGVPLATENYDAGGKRVVDPSGVWSYARKYDRLRNKIERTGLGVDGRPTSATGGSAIDRWTYDDNDDLVAESHFDAEGAPLMLGGEYATKRFVNDDRGLVIEEHYLDAHGEPTLGREGWATSRFLRDRNGDVTEESYFGTHDEPIVRSGGYAKKRNAYDIHRRRIESSLFAAAGAPTLGTDGWSTEREAYEERGLLAREDHLGVTGAPVLTTAGYASRTNVWDERGNLAEETTLGIDGKPIATAHGYATKRSAYDEMDLAEEAFLGADGKPVAADAGWSIRKLRHDEFGNVIEEAWFDVGHKPVAPKGGAFASVRSRFDARQRLIETSWFDGIGAPVAGPDRVPIVRYERDAYGRAIKTSYLDGSGIPAASKDGKLVVHSTYDDAGRLAEERFVDGAGAPRAASDGCAVHRTKYDPQGRKLEESCLGTNDALTFSTDGWAIRRTLHDARGHDVETATYAPDGGLHADKDGIARRKSHFDERNLLLETTYVDAADKPAHDKHGVHAIRFTHDDAGRTTSETTFDEHGRAMATKGTSAGR